ncbi:MAG: hypothetical protein IKQ10_09745 [Oscillospiraceae bacterium]|nr:hypothetical protein [Oscillospiraceae bacterium]MBR6353127.1 hypothetical protein [Oscillospiraceae bacterium]
MKKLIALLLAVVLLLSLAACSSAGGQKEADKVHKIGVIVYNLGDEEVIGFREYLQGYIEKNFEMVKFLYSDSIRSAEQEMAFIQDACDQGAEGFLSFLSYDLAAEVALCEQNKAYYLLASGTVDDADFDAVADNPWFLGMFGPGIELEYKAGIDMARFFVSQHGGDRYFILSGGASVGNEMHYQRALGMLYGLCSEYGASFGQPLETLAGTDKALTLSDKGLTVTICPGYMSNDESRAAAVELYTGDTYDYVLATLSIGEFYSSVGSAQLGMVDSYNTRNLQLFTNGTLHYLVGKYFSSVGPSVMLMLNALAGYGKDFREDGKAIRVNQSFWVSDSLTDYVDKYALSQSASMIAYNFDDLSQVCRLFNSEATLARLSALARANSYDDVLLRRRSG